MSLDKITQAVIDLKGNTTIPQDVSFGAYKAPKSGFETLCTTRDDDNREYVWAANDSSNAQDPKRRICTLDEYLAQCAKVKEFMKFYGYTFNQSFDVKSWNVWKQHKKKYWNGEGLPEVGDIVRHSVFECEVEFITKAGYFVLSIIENEKQHNASWLVTRESVLPVKTRKQLTVESVCEKMFSGNLGFTKSVVEQLYDLNLLKEID